MKKIFKILLWIAASLMVLVIAILLFISPIAKYVIEKNGEEYTGRQLVLNKLNINLLNGHISLKGFKMMEADKQKAFVSCDTLALDISLGKLLFSSILDIGYVNISGLTASITQKGEEFNFDDLIEKFTAPDTTAPPDTTPAEPFKYYIHNLSLKNGHFFYDDLLLGSRLEVIKADVRCASLAWDEPRMDYSFSFALQSKGEVDGNFSFVTETMDYLMNVKSRSVNLAMIHPYIKGYMSINAFEGELDSDLKLKGNFNTPSAIAVKGNIAINNILVVDKADKKTLSWTGLKITVDTLNTAQNLYDIMDISLTNPYVLFEMYAKGGNNFYELMNTGADTSVTSGSVTGPGSATATNPFKMLVDLIGEMTREYIITDYNIDKLSITGGTVLYKDYTLDDKFQYELEELELQSSGIRSESEKVTASLHSKLNKLGNLEMLATINPKDFKNLELICKIQDAPVPDFSPYSKYYVAHPFTNGRVSFTSENKLVNNFLTSNNKLNIKRMEIGKKVKRKDALNVPVRLAVSLLKDTKGNIKLEVPVEGDLNDPKYKLGKAIWGIVENILVKAATAPFRLLANTFGGNEEELKEMRFDYLQTSLSSSQTKTLDKLAEILTAKPELKLQVTQTGIKEAEKEQLALFEGKKAFYKEGHPGTDSLDAAMLKQINDIPLKDSLFNVFLNNKLKLPPGNTTPPLTKCINLSGIEFLNVQVSVNFTKREAYISDYLKRKNIRPERILFLPPDEKSITPETPPRMMFEVKIEE
jgi:hypothetical protein